ncbi:MAG: DUF4352 domain-containing protein [Actinomycetota bacterium]|nr:DUF4352 domain-containing protein [Actinomycetota bacterium]
MSKGRRFAAVAAVAVLTACSDAPSATTAPEASTSSPTRGEARTTTVAPEPRLAVGNVGEAFTLGDVRLTVLSVEDPFPSTPEVRPAPGNRLVLVRYEMISMRADALDPSALPPFEVRDAAGASFRSEHGRSSRTAAGVQGGTRIESSAVFEVPASATGLRAAFRARPPAQDEVVMVPLG